MPPGIVSVGNYITNYRLAGGLTSQSAAWYITLSKVRPGGDTIKAVKIIVCLTAFAAVIGIAAAIAILSVIVAPIGSKSGGLPFLAIALGGLGIAGGVVYLAEKLINLAKGVGFMLAELIVEKFKKREREIGRKENQREWRAWYERQQAALREGRPFTEPPPGYSPEALSNGAEAPGS